MTYVLLGIVLAVALWIIWRPAKNASTFHDVFEFKRNVGRMVSSKQDDTVVIDTAALQQRRK